MGRELQWWSKYAAVTCRISLRGGVGCSKRQGPKAQTVVAGDNAVEGTGEIRHSSDSNTIRLATRGGRLLRVFNIF